MADDGLKGRAVQPETGHVAPARYVLTVLHRQEPGIPAWTEGPDAPADGMTVCGLPMLAEELWQPVDRRDGDSICTGCMPRGGARAAEMQEATLW